jgi:hypothetical protein
MSNSVLLFGSISIALFLALVWILLRPLPERRLPDKASELNIESMFLLHCRNFPQLRQALSVRDREFLRGRLPEPVLKRWRTERRRVLCEFLEGLADDFVRMDYLARTVAVLSPEVKREFELQRLWLGLRFRVLYRLAWLRVVTGATPLAQFENVTKLVTALAGQLERALALDGAAAQTPRTSTGM